ncbi:hypothetical protein ACIBL3_16255 [Kribbella sp. NPDC050124]|uniref:hypothetical protein n=1 Tax=Kribbella sp. NPDC050124 TaxID=3364114 RepID=UPI0037B24178
MGRSDAGRPRGKGRLAWWCCLCLATATGLLCLVAKWGPAGAFICVLLGAMSAVVIASAIWSGDDGKRVGKGYGRALLAATVLAPAAIGLIGAFGFSGVLIVLMIAGTTPALVAYVRARWFTSEAPEPPAPEEPVLAPQVEIDEDESEATPDIGFLSAEELCLAWRRSFVRLEAALSPQVRLDVVEERQRYLDELYRRSPDGVAAWLAAGARASGNPLPYVGDDHRRVD